MAETDADGHPILEALTQRTLLDVAVSELFEWSQHNVDLFNYNNIPVGISEPDAS